MKAICYARTSTLDQAREEKVSIPNQIQWARDFCAEKGWEFTGEYIEPGITGDVEFEQRVAAKKILDEARPLYDPDRNFDLVLVYHSSRLAREADLVLKFHRLLAQSYKIQVFMRNVGVEPLEPENYFWGGNYIQQVTTALAGVTDQQENVTRGERVRSGFQGLAKRGVLVFAPYGYRKLRMIDNEGKYSWSFEIEPSTGLIIKKMFDLYGKKSYTIRKIMYEFNQKQIPSPSGKIGIEGWNSATVKNILSNPAYTGKVRWGRKLGSKYKQGRSQTGKQKRVILTPDKYSLVDGTHPKLIDDKLFNIVQERLKLRGIVKGRAIASTGLFTGILRCGICGRKGHYKTRYAKKGKYKYLRSDYICQTYIIYGKNACCRHIIASNKINKIVLNEIDTLIRKANKKKQLFYVGNGQQKGMWEQKLNLLQQEYEELQSQSKRLLRLYTSGKINMGEYGEEKEKLDSESLSKFQEIDELKAKVNNHDEVKEAEKRFIKMLSSFKEQFDKMDITKQKEMIVNLIESITVGKDNKIDIKYRI